MADRVLIYDSAGNILFPAAAVLGDSDTNPTTSTVGAALMVHHESNGQWLRARRQVTNTDAVAGTTGLHAGSMGYQYDDTDATWDRVRGNLDTTLLASAARTATTNSADQTNYNGRGVIVTLDVTSITDTPSVTLAIEAKDPVSGKYEKLLDAAAVTATGTHTYIVYPGASETAAEDVVEIHGYPLPRTWRVTITHADADPITYSVGGMVIL